MSDEFKEECHRQWLASDKASVDAVSTRITENFDSLDIEFCLTDWRDRYYSSFVIQDHDEVAEALKKIRKIKTEVVRIENAIKQFRDSLE
jgi:hypothetical protein